MCPAEAVEHLYHSVARRRPGGCQDQQLRACVRKSVLTIVVSCNGPSGANAFKPTTVATFIMSPFCIYKSQFQWLGDNMRMVTNRKVAKFLRKEYASNVHKAAVSKTEIGPTGNSSASNSPY